MQDLHKKNERTTIKKSQFLKAKTNFNLDNRVMRWKEGLKNTKILSKFVFMGIMKSIIRVKEKKK